MKTIQVRHIPDEAYETIRRRAEAEGRSLQSYMRDQIIELAAHPTKAEAIAAIEKALDRFGPAKTTLAEIVDNVHAERR